MTFVRRCFLGIPVALIFLGLLASAASAHAAFESATPEDGSTNDTPVAEVQLTFTGPVQPTGAGFEAFDGDGAIRSPQTQLSKDGATWILTFDPPLVGLVGVRWEVNAPDAHPFTGAISFEARAEVAAPLPSTPSFDAAEPAASPRLVDAETPEPAARLAEFLDDGESGSFVGMRLGDLGRVSAMVGTVLAIGSLAFSVVVLRGAPMEFRLLMHWMRRAALLLVLAVALEGASLVISSGDGTSALLQTSNYLEVASSLPGAALGLRLVGASMLLAASRVPVRDAETFGDPVVRIRELVGAGAELAGLGERQPVDPRQYRESGDSGWAPHFTPTHPVVGALLIVLSFSFDGHTISTGSWLAMALLDAIHVAAAAVWAGGVAMLALVMHHRHRQNRPIRAGQLALRFSVVAAIAVTAVGLAGAAMAMAILQTPGDLLNTPWGRTLLAKSAVVAVAAGLGAYNHRVLIPEMAADPEDGAATARFRVAIRVEVALLISAALLTAFLVAAASQV